MPKEEKNEKPKERMKGNAYEAELGWMNIVPARYS